jgi:hypothetical protein
VLDVSDVDESATVLAPGADRRTELTLYRLCEDAEVVAGGRMTTVGPRAEGITAAADRTRMSPGSARRLAEAAVLVGAACIALHLLTAFGAHRQDVVLTAVTAGMAVACAPCLRALRMGPTRRDWQVTGAMYAAMLTAHLGWLVVGPVHAVHSHASGELSWSDLGMWGALGLAGVQLLLTATGLTCLREGNRT